MALIRTACSQLLSLSNFDPSLRAQPERSGRGHRANSFMFIHRHVEHTFHGGRAQLEARCLCGGSARVFNTCHAHSQSRQAEPDYSAALDSLYERVTPIIDLMFEEIGQASFVNDAVSEVTGEETDQEEKREVVANVVRKHFNRLEEGILVALAGYSQAAWGQQNKEVAETLEMIREEVLRQFGKLVPQEMQALEQLISMVGSSSSHERVDLLKRFATDGANGLPPTDLVSIRSMASQLLEDMEEKPAIVDRRLLSRLCVVREEADVAAEALGQMQPGNNYYDVLGASRRLLQKGAAAFTKELLLVFDADRRRALLEKCLREDWQGQVAASEVRWQKQGVRPARLLTCMGAMEAELSRQGLQANHPQMVRLQEIRTEALSILEDLAQ